MQENILPHFELKAIEGTLLTRDYLAANKRAHNIDCAARDHAKKIINDAWYQSERIIENALQDGFESGLIYCIEQIVLHFKAIENEHAALQRVMQQEIIDVLEDVFRDNSLFLCLVSEWYKKNCADTATEVVISLPRQDKNLAEQLCRKLRGWLLTEPQIVFHNYNFYQVKSGDKLMVFNADDFISGMVRRLIVNNEDILVKIRNISNESLDKIQALFINP